MSGRIHRLTLVALSLMIALALLLSFSAGAEAVRPAQGPDGLAAGADAIVVGNVLGSLGSWNAYGTRIYSEVTVSVEESLKGLPCGTTITVIVPGGTVGEIAQRLSDTPRFTEGERAMLVLKQLPAERLSEKGIAMSDLSLPLFELDRPHWGELYETQEAGSDPPSVVLSEWVSGTTRPDNSASATLQVESSTIEVEESGFVYNGMKWPGDWPVVGYKVNAPNSAGNTAVQNAGATWSNAGATFAFSYAGTHSRTGGYLYNGVNEVMWVDLGVGGPLGRAVWWYNPATGQIVEADMEFNTRYSWSTATPTPSGSIDVETVALHEFGHWLSLGHSDIPEAIMYAYYKGQQRWLHDDDIAGIHYIYGAVPAYTISGIILDVDQDPVEGVTVAATVGHEQTVYTDEHGYYELTGVAYEAVDIIITPALSGYTVNPEFILIEGPVTADIENQDFTAVQRLPANRMGIYRPGERSFYLDMDGGGVWDDAEELGPFGLSSDVPVVGDGTGDGFDQIGIWRVAPGTYQHYFALDMDYSGTWTEGDVLLGPFGQEGDVPIIGDWTGDGTDQVGVWRPGERCFYLDMDGDGVFEDAVKLGPFGLSTDVPVIGDWDGSGTDQVGIWRASDRIFALNMDYTGTWNSETDVVLGPFGLSTDVPIIGDWDGSGIDQVGIWRASNRIFALNMDYTGIWNSETDLVLGPFGLTTDVPIIGRWKP